MDNLNIQLRAIQRRQAVIRFSPELIVYLSRGRYEILKNELPDDARVVGGYFDQHRNSFCVVVESDTFPNTPIDVALPELPTPHVKRWMDGEVPNGNH